MVPLRDWENHRITNMSTAKTNTADGSTIEQAIERAVEQAAPKPQHKTEVGRFGGTFAGYGLGLYNTLIACQGCSKQLAHLIAVDYLNDWARGVNTNDALKSKVGKATAKDDTCKMKGNMETAKMISSNAMKIARIVQQQDDLVSEKVLIKRTFPALDCLPATVREYVEEKLEKAKTTVWAD